MRIEHYFINGVSLCQKWRYSPNNFYYKNMTKLEIGFDTDKYCEVCNYKLKQILRLRRGIKRKRIVKT